MNIHLLRLLFLSTIVLFMHYVAIKLYLYWTIWWYDILMHFLGGLVIGTIVALFFSLRKQQHALRWFFVVVLIVGILWEVFELFAGDTTLADYRDSLADLVMDLVGALAAYYVALDSHNRLKS